MDDLIISLLKGFGCLALLIGFVTFCLFGWAFIELIVWLTSK